MVRRLTFLAATTAVLLALVAIPALAAGAGRDMAQKLPDPNAAPAPTAKTTSSGSSLPHTGLSALPLFLSGLALLAAGRLILPARLLAAPSFDRYLFQVQRRRYLSDRS